MVNVITDMKFPVNQICYAGAGPEVCRISSSLSPFQQQVFELWFAFRGEFWRAAGRRMGFKAFPTVFNEAGFPAADGPAVNFKFFSDFNRLESIFEQDDGLQTSLFQLFRAAVWAHGAPPAHSIGHYLYRNQ